MDEILRVLNPFQMPGTWVWGIAIVVILIAWVSGSTGDKYEDKIRKDAPRE